MKIEDRVRAINLEISEPVKPLGAYLPALLCGNQIYVSGQLPFLNGELLHPGLLGRDITIEQGYEAARICALNSLSAIKTVLSDLDKIKRIVKINGYVSSEKGFNDQPKIINGASEFFFEIFGESGRHARSAVGVPGLPMGSCVELDLIAEI